MAVRAATPQEVQSLSGSMKTRKGRIRVASHDEIAPQIDTWTGAPGAVRMKVGAAPSPQDRLATLRTLYPDAQPIGDNFIFTSPQTGKRTLYNPKGLDWGDWSSVGMEGAEFLGALGGALGGTAVAAVPGAVVGAGVGAATAKETARGAIGPVDTRTPEQKAKDAGVTAVFNAAGEGAGALLGRAGTRMAKWFLRGGAGEAGRQELARRLALMDAYGLKPTLNLVADKPSIAMIEKAVNYTPAANVITSTVEQLQKDIAEQVMQRVQKSVGVGDAEAGGIVREGIENHVGRFKAQSKLLFNAIDQHIAPASPTPVTNTMAALDRIVGPIAGAPNLSESSLVSNPILREVRELLKKDMDPNTGTVPFQALRELRTRIGAKLTDAALIGDVSHGELKALYGALSEDIGVAAQAAGPDAQAAYIAAQKHYRDGLAFIDDKLQKIVGKNKLDEAITKSLDSNAKGGGTLIRAAREALTDDEFHIYRDAFVARMGKSPASGQTFSGDMFSTQTFLTNWAKMSDDSKDALFGAKGTQFRKDMDDIAEISSIIRDAGRNYINPSGTASAFGAGSFGLGAIAALMTGNLFALKGILATTAGAYGIAKLMTNRAFIHWLAVAPKINPGGIPAHLGKLAAIAVDAQDPDERQALMNILESYKAQPTPTN